MYRKSKLFFMHNITPSHVGSGDSLSVIDMPIQRERHTSYPKIEGSSLKGSIREVFREMSLGSEDGQAFRRKINLTFGPEDNGQEYAGSLGFIDGRILLFPVKSVKGVFAWITSPEVLKRLKNDLKLTNEQIPDALNNIPVINNTDDASYCIPSTDTVLKVGNNVILEEYSFKIMENDNAQLINCDSIAEFIGNKLGMSETIKKRLLIISDDDFKDFVSLSTEVITRTKIVPETGIVKDGALFTEEYLPAETILYSIALASPVFKNNGNDNNLGIRNEEEVMSFFTTNIPELIQIGGNATLGKGLVKIIMGGGNNA